MKRLDIDALISEFRIHPSRHYPEPNYTMGLSVGSVLYRFGGEGDISVVTGKAKSRKTFLMAIMAASALTFEKITDKISDGKSKVLYFDTEQSNFHASKSLRRILALTGEDFSNHIEYYGLRGLSVANRVVFIDSVINRRDGIKAVFIDGARDLVTSINDEHQATHVIDSFSRWTRTGGFHLVTVLHENSSSDKLRGHLGTELTNKAENVFAVEIDRKSSYDMSKVYTRFSRNGDMIEFVFVVDEMEIPRIESSTTKRLEHDTPEVKAILRECFNGELNMGHTVLVDKFQDLLKNAGIEKGKNTLKKWLEKYLESGIVGKEGAYRSPRAYYYFKGG